MADEETTIPINAINIFYKLKNAYETDYYDKYVKPIVNSYKLNKEKRVDYSKLPKPECINCKKNVGTLFTIKTDREEDVRKFTAKCGDLSNPCPLDIQINYSIRDNLYHAIVDGTKSIENLKMQIIKEKNNALFFRKDVVDIFEKITNELKSKTESVGFAIETNLLRNDNPEKYELLKRNLDEFGKGFIVPFKQMIATYMDKRDELVLNEAITFYKNEMMPKLKEIQNMKYATNYVEYLQDKTYRLIQQQNSLENNEFFIKEDDKVVKFIKGNKKNTNKKTLKQKETVLVNDKAIKNKTKKKIPIKLIIEEGDTIVLGNNNNVNRENEIKENEIKDKNEVWNRIPANLRNILNEDAQWKEEYIQSCVNLRKNGKPCELFLPKQTIFPPKLENGKYDFNSVPVNNLFNSLDKEYQDTLLTLKNGTNYNMLKNVLVELLTNNMIGYNKGYF